MRKEWKEQGKCKETELNRLIAGMDYSYFVAYQTDKFLSGADKPSSLDRIEWHKLLEIRLFSAEKELLARRTMIGENNEFQWRIASEAGLHKEEYIVRYQTLDIDSAYTKEGEWGNLNLMTTGGGTYELPIERNMTGIKVISYIGYSSEDGMAYIYDNRLAGFMAGGEK